MKTCFLYCTAFILLFFCFVAKVSARTIFEDHFDGQDLSGWKVVQNFQWMDPAQPCMNGSSPAAWQLYLQQLGIRIFSPGCFTEIIPLTFELPSNRSYSFEFDMTLPESIDMDRNYTLRHVNARNAYAMKVLGQRIFMEKLVDGQGWGVNGSSGFYPFQPNGTYHIKNEVHSDHSMRVFINNELVLSFMDTAPFLDGGTIGFRASVGAIPNSITWFDNALVELTDTVPTLPIPYVSQRDLSWKNEVYDHTTQTIEKLGCALASAVMVLRYYGIHEISEGLLLTPSTLNAWLNAQSDGYIASGLVNWIALTRLARQFHIKYPHIPTLEYTKKAATASIVQTEFLFNRPPIIDLSGHFVVGTGFDFNEFSILDPYYANKHTLLLTDAKSLRTFTPSFTNLRYIQVIAPESVKILVERSGQAWVSEIEKGIRPEDDVVSTESYSILEIPKPEFGEYSLKLSSAVAQKAIIVIRRYDEHVTVVEDTLQTLTNSEDTLYTLPYSPRNSEPIEPHIDDKSLQNTLHTLWELKEIQTPDIYVALRLVAEKLPQVEVSHKIQLSNALKYYLERYTDQISSDGKQILLDIVNKMWLLQGSDL